jgi:uncharacterized protein YukE
MDGQNHAEVGLLAIQTDNHLDGNHALVQIEDLTVAKDASAQTETLLGGNHTAVQTETLTVGNHASAQTETLLGGNHATVQTETLTVGNHASAQTETVTAGKHASTQTESSINETEKNLERLERLVDGYAVDYVPRTRFDDLLLVKDQLQRDCEEYEEMIQKLSSELESSNQEMESVDAQLLMSNAEKFEWEQERCCTMSRIEDLEQALLESLNENQQVHIDP